MNNRPLTVRCKTVGVVRRLRLYGDSSSPSVAFCYTECMKATLYQYSLKNISVVDGDTLKADLDLGFGVILVNKKIRLEHVNCPEKDTDEGLEAKWFTESCILGETNVTIMVKNHREDKYGRILGTVTYDGHSLADQIKLAGHGVDYEGGKR